MYLDLVWLLIVLLWVLRATGDHGYCDELTQFAHLVVARILLRGAQLLKLVDIHVHHFVLEAFQDLVGHALKDLLLQVVLLVIYHIVCLLVRHGPLWYERSKVLIVLGLLYWHLHLLWHLVLHLLHISSRDEGLDLVVRHEINRPWLGLRLLALVIVFLVWVSLIV